jgi:GcrA cell cycle regulator
MEMTGWEPEAIATLVQNIDRMSSGQFAARLGRSRAAVCGMIWRLRGKGVLPPAGTAKHYDADPHKNRRQRPSQESITMPREAKPKPPPKPKPQTSGERVALALALAALKADGMRMPMILPGCSLIELTDHLCKFPLGEMLDPPPFLFCGIPSLPGLPYCLEHCRLAYQPTKGTDRHDQY